MRSAGDNPEGGEGGAGSGGFHPGSGPGGGIGLGSAGSAHHHDSHHPHHRDLPTPTFHDEGQEGTGTGSALPASTSSTTPAAGGGARRRARARFDTGELAQVCSRFDIGAIESVREFRRGSGRAPKVVIQSDRGRYLLKRRPAGPNSPARVGFSHALQLHLAKRKFPLPQLIGTRTDHSTLLILDNHIYELFEFVEGGEGGGGYDQSLDATADAGRALGLFHALLRNFSIAGMAPSSASYHAASGLAPHLDSIASRMQDDADRATIASLRARYDRAAERAEAQGFSAWPVQIIHGDWHPGNMLFRGNRVAAVIDYDTVRRAPRMVDIANGALQFSITMTGRDPALWPEPLDEGRLKRFCRGYETVKGCVISLAELNALPWLMIEALIVEGAVPIAATGSFAGHSGSGFLRMIDGKTRWIESHAQRLTNLLAG